MSDDDDTPERDDIGPVARLKGPWSTRYNNILVRTFNTRPEAEQYAHQWYDRYGTTLTIEATATPRY